MPVTEHVSWTASCDECGWFEDGLDHEEAGAQALDDHIREEH